MIVRIIAVLVLVFSLNGCWFFIVPLGPIIDAFKGKTYCVSKNATVGSRVRMPDGEIGTIKRIKGPVSDCPNSLIPIGAEIAFDGSDAAELKTTTGEGGRDGNE